MNMIRYTLVSAGILASMPLISISAVAAESYDNCTNFIDSIPATISTQGVWCVRKDLSTSISSGSAISIAANNVTIDCNDFKIGGLAAGNGSQAIGIYASGRQNATVRRCNVRGFRYGIRLVSGAGHLVEDNRLDNNLYMGLYVAGDNSMVRRNRIYDTGGGTVAGYNSHSYGINVDGTSTDTLDNTIAGLFADQPGGHLRGIDAGTDNGRISGNAISGYDMTAVQGGSVDYGVGIFTSGQHTRVSDNQISGGDLTAINGSGVSVNGGIYSSAYCLNNTVGGFTTTLSQCDVSDGNHTLP